MSLEPATKPCAADGCDRPTVRRGRWCSTHHNRHYRHGDVDKVIAPAERRKNLGPESARWKGDDVSYFGMHDRVRAARGSASAHTCVDCGGPAGEWSYRGGDPDERRHAVGAYNTLIAYSLDVAFYDPRCIPCHRHHDREAH